MKVVVSGSLSFDYIMDFPGRFADRIMPDKPKFIKKEFIRCYKKNYGTAIILE